jgi:thymidine kinase
MSLDIIIGPMFAGKSSRIADIVSRYEALGSRVLLVKPKCDNRYDSTDTSHVTHNRRKTVCISVNDLDDISKEAVANSDIIIVDEAQFFSHLIAFCEWIVDTHTKKLYLVGLDGDSNRRPFGEILDCIPLADRVEKLHAFCKKCANGTPGIFSYRRSRQSNEQVMVGGSDIYETLCRECYLRQFIE